MDALLITNRDLIFAAALCGAAGGWAGWRVWIACGDGRGADSDARARLAFALRVADDVRNHLAFLCAVLLNRVDRLLAYPVGSRRCEPWSGESFDACIRLSLFTPVIGLFATWLRTGDAGMLGGTVGLLRNADLTLRTAVMVAVIGAGFGLRRVRAWPPKQALFGVFGSFFLIGLCNDLVADSDPASLAGKLASNGTFMGAAILGTLVVVAAGFSGTRAFALASLCMTAIAVNDSAAVLHMALMPLALALVWTADKPEVGVRLGRFWALSWPLLLLVVGVVLVVEARMHAPQKGRIAMIALVLAPLLAAPLVWVAWDASRSLMRCALSRPLPTTPGGLVLLAGIAAVFPMAEVAIAAGYTCVSNANILVASRLISVVTWPAYLCGRPPMPWPAAVWGLVLLPLLPAALIAVAILNSLFACLVPRRSRDALIQLLRREQPDDPRIRRRILLLLVLPAGVGTSCAFAILLAGLVFARSVLWAAFIRPI